MKKIPLMVDGNPVPQGYGSAQDWILRAILQDAAETHKGGWEVGPRGALRRVRTAPIKSRAKNKHPLEQFMGVIVDGDVVASPISTATQVWSTSPSSAKPTKISNVEAHD